MFNLHNSFIVEAFLFFFIKLICFREFLLCISSGVGIKHPYIEKCHLTCFAKTHEHIRPTSLHFLWLLMEQRTRLLKIVIGGSTRTSLHTSLRSDDVMSLKTFCRNDTNPPFLQDRACWRSNFSPHSRNSGSFASVHP